MPSAVVGNGPIGFTKSDGTQQSIPLSLLYFENSTVKADKWPLYNDNKAVVDALLKTLVAGGFLIPAPTPPPQPAIVLKAAIPGAKGNTIQVTFSNIVAGLSPPGTTFDAEITAKAIYSGLSVDPKSLSFIGKVLGVGATTPGISPGLVRVQEPAQNTAILFPAITDSTLLADGTNSAKSSLAVLVNGDPLKTAFTLEAWKEGADGNNIKVSIPDVNSGTETFTLVVEWTQPKITSIALTDLSSGTKLQGDKFVIEVLKPEGADFGIPAPGTIVLSGGADATGALPAGIVAFSR